jgi:predicted Holliday junction resolvase-like endonuclease
MTVKQIFSLIGGGIVAFLFAILGIQRKKISKQKEEIKEQAAEIKTEKKKVEVKDLEVTTIKEVTENEKKLDEKEATIKEEIQEATNDSDVIASINIMLDKFNRRL